MASGLNRLDPHPFISGSRNLEELGIVLVGGNTKIQLIYPDPMLDIR
jgi:hypothetical protein